MLRLSMIMILPLAAPAAAVAYGFPYDSVVDYGAGREAPLNQSDTLVLSSPADPYFQLAQQIAREESLPIVHGIPEVLEQAPRFLLWVGSPPTFTERALADLGLRLQDRGTATAVGIITGSTPEEASGLYRRAKQAGGLRACAVNGQYPSAGIPDGRILSFVDQEVTLEALSKADVVGCLQNAGYVTFTGHGGGSYWRLDDGARLTAQDLPRLASAVVTAAACRTFLPAIVDSIALGFVSRGAAAYGGFVFSPIEGYLIGEFDGLPLRYTWPGFPAGLAVLLQGRGTTKGFSRFPFYYLLGDSRLALQAEPPYRLTEIEDEGEVRTLTYAAAPYGFIPVRVSGGASYPFVEVPGVTSVGEGDPFYNARLQMMNAGEDKYILFSHRGGGFTLRLHRRAPWYRVFTDPSLDALDNTLIILPAAEGSILLLLPAIAAAAVAVRRVILKRVPARALPPAVLAGLILAALHAAYGVYRVDQVTVTSKPVMFSPFSILDTFVLGAAGCFFFITARTRYAKAGALLIGGFAAFAPAAFALGAAFVTNEFFARPRLGTSLYNYNLGLMSSISLVFEMVLFLLIFSWIKRRWRIRPATANSPQDPQKPRS